MFVVLIDKAADHRIMQEMSAEVIIFTLGLLAGVAWEKAFARSIDSCTYQIGIWYPNLQLPSDTAICAFFMVMIVPGWCWFILPQAIKKAPPREFDQQEGGSEEPATVVPKVEAFLAGKEEPEEGEAQAG